jgi:hypothetical protein
VQNQEIFKEKNAGSLIQNEQKNIEMQIKIIMVFTVHSDEVESINWYNDLGKPFGRKH